MPRRAPRPCTHPGCSTLTETGRCEAHPRKAWAKAKEQKRLSGRALQRARHQLFTLNPLCAECERQGFVRVATQRDHIIPMAQGGTEDPSNIQGLCGECHDAKTEREKKAGRGGSILQSR